MDNKKLNWTFEITVEGNLNDMTMDEAEKIMDKFIELAELNGLFVGGGFVNKLEVSDGTKESKSE